MQRFLLQYATRLAIVLAVMAALAGIATLAQVLSIVHASAFLALLFAAAFVLAFVVSRAYVRASHNFVGVSERYEQMQAAVSMQNRGYMLFNDHGELLETRGASGLLGIDKLAHFDDLVNAVRDGAELMTQFRRLQQIGEPFSFKTVAPRSHKHLNIRGERQHLKSGTAYDSIWIRDDTELQHVRDQATRMIENAGAQKGAWQTALDQLPFPVWLKDDDLRIAWVNSVYAQAVDMSVADIIDQQVELGGNTRTLAARSLGATKPQTMRLHLVIKGRRRLMEITYASYKQGDKSALIGTAVDVTKEEEKQIELERHLHANQEVLEGLGTPIAIYGSDHRLDFYNRAYLRLWNHDEAFLQSRPTLGEILEDLRTRRLAPEQADFQRYKRERVALFTSLIEPREDMMYMPDGKMLRILAVPHPFGGVMFIHEDVTDKLTLESSYNTLMAVQRETLDNLSEGIAVFGSDGRLKLSNPAFARIWKLAPEQIVDEPHITELLEHMKPLFTYDTWTTFKSEFVAYTLERENRSGRLERSDHSIIEFSTVPLPDGAILNSYLDVSDSVRVEQALRASNAALANADRLKSEFVANVSYQLRTPLSTIMGFAEILTNQYFGTLNERQMEYARTMMESSKRLKALIDDVLDLATIEAGRMALERRMVGLMSLLQSVVQLINERARQSQIDVTLDCEANIGSAELDERRIKQVLFNLVSNAIQYSPQGGRITLKARKQGPWIYLSVIDNGMGIPEADQDRIWGKFERANKEARQSGAGLGLSLVKSFIELHGGRIELKSQAGQGTSVTCILPVHASDSAVDKRLAAE